MLIRAEGNNYQVRDGVRPDAAQYRQVRALARAEGLLKLTRLTVETATRAENATAALELTYKTERQQRQIEKLRAGLQTVLA